MRVEYNEKNSSFYRNCSESVVCEHQLEFSHEFDWEYKKIVDYVSDYRKRLTSEIIHIKFNQFSINKRLSNRVSARSVGVETLVSLEFECICKLIE